MKARGFAATFATVGALAALWIGVTFPLAMTFVTGSSFHEEFCHGGVQGGIIFGLAMGLVGALRLRAIRKTFAFKTDRVAFVSQLTLLLAEWNYHPVVSVGDTISFSHAAVLPLPLHRITVAVDDTQATVLGPATDVARLARAFEAGRPLRR